jgi:multidrug efflux pump subunit AcrB
VLFDFIEERHAEGAPLIDALLEAGIMRLRPVLITVAATVIALLPLASHGGPLWEAMCYAHPAAGAGNLRDRGAGVENGEMDKRE